LTSSPRFSYHYYKGKELEAFNLLNQKLQRGECSEREYVEFIFRQHGGVCAELSRMGAVLLRMAGIPTAVSSGWAAGFWGRVRREGHQWAEVFIPHSNGNRMYGIPVEFAEARVGFGFMLKEIILNITSDVVENKGKIITALSSVGVIIGEIYKRLTRAPDENNNASARIPLQTINSVSDKINAASEAVNTVSNNYKNIIDQVFGNFADLCSRSLSGVMMATGAVIVSAFAVIGASLLIRSRRSSKVVEPQRETEPLPEPVLPIEAEERVEPVSMAPVPTEIRPAGIDSWLASATHLQLAQACRALEAMEMGYSLFLAEHGRRTQYANGMNIAEHIHSTLERRLALDNDNLLPVENYRESIRAYLKHIQAFASNNSHPRECFNVWHSIDPTIPSFEEMFGG